MKNRIGFFIAGCLACVLSSCLGGDDSEYTVDKNCQIAAFTLQHDSVPGLNKVKFTIDQLTGRIFNADSLPYGTKLAKAICTVTYMNSYAIMSTAVMQQAVGDTIYWNGTDSLDFTKPVRFSVMAYDGLTVKDYTAKVNIHQQDPDSMVWSLYANQITGIRMKEQQVITQPYGGGDAYFMYVRPAEGNGYRLYQSPVSDARTWKEIPLSGLPDSGMLLAQLTAYDGLLYLPSSSGGLYRSADGQQWEAAGNTMDVRCLLGAVREGQKQPSALAAIVNKDNVLTFAAMNKDKVWTSGDAVPASFPVTGFGSIDYNSMYHEYLMVAGGRDKEQALLSKVWATMDGISWAQLTNDKLSNFGKREGVMLAKYDDQYFLIGGLTEDGKGSKDIFTSIDKGITWMRRDSLVTFPDSYAGRGFSSVQVDKDQFMLLFSGKTGQAADEVNEIWRGRINRLGY